MEFHRSLSDNKSPELILVDALVWIISICPQISNPSTPLIPVFGDHSNCADYNYYNGDPHASQFIQFSGKVEELVSLFAIFDVYSVVCWDGKMYYSISYLFFC